MGNDKVPKMKTSGYRTMNMLFIINYGGKYQKKLLKGLKVVIQDRANFPKLVAGDQALQ